jgi:hypothetical protein
MKNFFYSNPISISLSIYYCRNAECIKNKYSEAIVAAEREYYRCGEQDEKALKYMCILRRVSE